MHHPNTSDGAYCNYADPICDGAHSDGSCCPLACYMAGRNSIGYKRCSGRTSVYLCAASLQNLAVQQDICSLSVSIWDDLADPVFDDVGLAGFKSRASAFLLA